MQFGDRLFVLQCTSITWTSLAHTHPSKVVFLVNSASITKPIVAQWISSPSSVLRGCTLTYIIWLRTGFSDTMRKGLNSLHGGSSWCGNLLEYYGEKKSTGASPVQSGIVVRRNRQLEGGPADVSSSF